MLKLLIFSIALCLHLIGVGQLKQYYNGHIIQWDSIKHCHLVIDTLDQDSVWLYVQNARRGPVRMVKGLVLVWEGDQKTIFNLGGDCLLKRFQRIYAVSDSVICGESQSEWAFISTRGDTLAYSKWGRIASTQACDSLLIVATCSSDYSCNWGLLGRDYRWILPPRFNEIRYDNNGVIHLLLKDGRHFELIAENLWSANYNWGSPEQLYEIITAPE